MNNDLIATESVEINASPEQVWDALTNPEKIKVYLFGTETITDWKEGNPIIFQGDYDNQHYKDKGEIIEYKENNVLMYSYWSGMSGLEDKPENYSYVTYKLDKLAEDKTKFTWHQQGFAKPESCEHTQSLLGDMLTQIKNLVESEK